MAVPNNIAVASVVSGVTNTDWLDSESKYLTRPALDIKPELLSDDICLVSRRGTYRLRQFGQRKGTSDGNPGRSLICSGSDRAGSGISTWLWSRMVLQQERPFGRR